jgi:uncharacterized protein (DUF433 family)
LKLPSFLKQDADGFIHLTRHRIGLQHLVHYYNEGFSPEMLACEYPSLTLAEIHKVLAFYLENRLDVDGYIASHKDQIEEQRRSSTTGPTLAELRQRLQATRGTEGA